MKKHLAVIIAATVLVACGGEEIPVVVTLNDNTTAGGTDGSTTPTGNETSGDTDDGSAPGNMDGSTPPTGSTDGNDTPTGSTDGGTTPTPGPCVDTPPLNDGFGWNGIATCALPVIPDDEPTDDGSTDGDGSIDDSTDGGGSTDGGNSGPVVLLPDGGAHYECQGSGTQTQAMVFAPPQNVQDANGVVVGRYIVDEALLEIQRGASRWEYEIRGNTLALRQITGTTNFVSGSCEFQAGVALQPVQLVSDVGYLCYPYNNTVTSWVWDMRRDGVYDENGVKTGDWFYSTNDRVRLLPDRNDPVYIREQPDRTLRLSNNDAVEWGYCDITEGAELPRLQRLMFCGWTNPARDDYAIVEWLGDSGTAGRFSQLTKSEPGPLIDYVGLDSQSSIYIDSLNSSFSPFTEWRFYSEGNQWDIRRNSNGTYSMYEISYSNSFTTERTAYDFCLIRQ